jgi:hypothetical protein
MNTVCIIHSYPGAGPTLDLLWPGFKKVGLPLVGVETIDGEHHWPESIPTVTIGINKHWMVDRRQLPSRLINTLGYFLSTEYDRCLVVEYDTLFTAPMPEYASGLVLNRAGGQLPNTRATQFFHSPWIFDRKNAAAIIPHGASLIANGECDTGPNGSPDVFLGLIVDDLKLEWEPSNTFSANTIEGPFIEPARKAYWDGCWMFHGIKKREQLESITQ